MREQPLQRGLRVAVAGAWRESPEVKSQGCGGLSPFCGEISPRVHARMCAYAITVTPSSVAPPGPVQMQPCRGSVSQPAGVRGAVMRRGPRCLHDRCELPRGMAITRQDVSGDRVGLRPWSESECWLDVRWCGEAARQGMGGMSCSCPPNAVPSQSSACKE